MRRYEVPSYGYKKSAEGDSPVFELLNPESIDPDKIVAAQKFVDTIRATHPTYIPDKGGKGLADCPEGTRLGDLGKYLSEQASQGYRFIFGDRRDDE